MPKHTLYAYVEGADLEDVAAGLEQRFVAFVEGRTWTCPDAWAVNQRHGRDASSRPEDLPAWELGINVKLPDPGMETAGWFGDIEAVARLLAELHGSTGRSFVIGIFDSERGFGEDLVFVDDSEPDLVELRSLIGVRDTG